MIHELRIYTAMPGRLPDVIARFRDSTLPIWKRLDIQVLSFWTTIAGTDSNDLTYIIAWESLADREVKWANFVKDPEWIVARRASESDGPIVARMSNSILAPVLI